MTRRRFTPAALGLLLLAMLIAAPGASADAVEDLDGCRDFELLANDDESTDAIPMAFPLDFFGQELTTAYVNNNGNVTFDAPLGAFTPYDFTITGDVIMAPFFGDVDTTGTGKVTYGLATFEGKRAQCVIWDDVGYYESGTDKVNRFQLLAVEHGDEGEFDLIFNYDSVQWDSGDADGGVGGLGGVPATAGWSSGDGDPAHSAMLAGSLSNGGLLDSNAETGLANNSLNSSVRGRYIWEIRGGSVAGGRLTGEVQDPDGDPVIQAPVQVCRDGGHCVTRLSNNAGVYTASGLQAGSYTVTAYPSDFPPYSPGTAGPVDVDDDTVTLDVILGPAPEPPPPGTSITSNHETEDGIPVVYWSDPLDLQTRGCPGGTAAYEVVVDGEVVRSGPMAEGPAGTYSATIQPLAPAHGVGFVSITIDCPGAEPDEAVEFGIYIDPSGFVRDTLGRPIPDATVLLLRSGSPNGPFFPVPDGSVLMSPSNRTNPDLTDGTGHFGWDVVAGYYLVRASKDGCVGASNRSLSFEPSRIMEIPPPVTDLDLRLFCGEGGGSGGGGGGQPTTTVGTPPPDGGTTSKVTLATLKAVKLVRGRVVRLRVTCSRLAVGRCSGRVVAKLKRKKLGQKRFSGLQPGSSKKVKVKLTRKGRRIVRRQRKRTKLTVRVVMTDRAGGRQTLQRKLTIRPR